MSTRDAGMHDHPDALRARLDDAEDMLRAIRQGEIDALIVEGADGSHVYTLHSAEEPYRHLVEQMQEGAVVLTRRGDILYANARFADLVGQPLTSVIGGRIHRFVNGGDGGGLETLLAAGSGRCRASLIGRGSGGVDVSLSLTTTLSAGGDRLNLIVTDLRELLEANNGRDRAERNSRTKDEFLAMLAHELRNPIGAIGSAVRVLDVTQAAEPARRARGVISRQVAHISQMFNDLLDMERVGSGRIRLDRRPLDMADAVLRTVATVTGDAGVDRQIEVTTEPLWINADALRIEQVLTNLVVNAVKYTPPGGRIHVALRADGNDAVLTVDDTGVGILPALLPSIFELYVQGDRTLDRARGGLGIGLTLVRRLVELHGGAVTASSPGEGRGSRFCVRLPLIHAAVASPPPAVSLEQPAKTRRVLIIENDKDARETLRMMLELAGHVVYEAPDAACGLELLKAVHPDVGIIEVGLPVTDGYQVARRIRAEPHGRGMLLLAVTGDGAPGEPAPSPEHGFDFHVQRPVDAVQLARLMSIGAGVS